MTKSLKLTTIIISFFLLSYLTYFAFSFNNLYRLNQLKRPLNQYFFNWLEVPAWPVAKLVSFLPPAWQTSNQVISLANSSYNLYHSVNLIGLKLIQNHPFNYRDANNFQKDYSRWLSDWLEIYPNYIYWSAKLKKYWHPRSSLSRQNLNLALAGSTLINKFGQIMGIKNKKRYYFLIQNNYELRPTGGFMGTIAELELNKGQWQISFHDVYEYDGNLPGHVDPPPAIETAFKTGFWKLRDANWNYDFHQSAKDIAWFLNQSQAKKADGLIALNYTTIKKIVSILGEIYIPEAKIRLNSQNIYQVLHQPVSHNFYPGSKFKSRILAQFGYQFLNRIQTAPTKTKIKIAKIILNDLNNREIFIYSFNPTIENNLTKLGWGGGLSYQASQLRGYFNDYFYLIESNLTANKLDCCLSRRVKDNIFIDSQNVSHQLEIKYNKSLAQKYLAYIQLVLPIKAYNFNLTIAGQKASYQLVSHKKSQTLDLDFWLPIQKNQKENKFSLSYQIRLQPGLSHYQLLIQKQPGLNYEYHFNVYNYRGRLVKSGQILIDKDQAIKLKWPKQK